MRPMFDPLDPYYKSITGAIPTQDSTIFNLCLPLETGSDWVNMCVMNGAELTRIPMIMVEETRQYRRWSCCFAPKTAGIYYYYFEAEGSWVPAIIKMDQNLQGTFDYACPYFQLTVYEKGYTTPNWMRGGVMYQIFPDRFYRSGRQLPPMENRVLRDDWGGMPVWAPNEEGKILNNDYFGGDLEGVRQKLPYLQELGVTCIYLNPVFYAGSNHRYDTWDYEQIDPWLGSEEDLQRLCREAKEMGIRIILDGVFSHNGDGGKYFDRYGKWETPGAYQDKNSPYSTWFTFKEDGSYDSWWGIDTLPNVNENAPAYLDYICGPNGVLQKWQKLGVAGWRLDVADELPDEFLFRLRERVKETDPNGLVLGEVWEDASVKVAYGQLRPYLQGKQLDSVMNYPFKEAILDFLKYGDGGLFVRRIRTIIDHYPKQTLDVLMNFLSTHDVERAMTRLVGEPLFEAPRSRQAATPLTEEQYRWGVSMMKAALGLLYFLPGVPCVYYGDEMGMSGYRDPFNRGCMNWDHGDGDIHHWVTMLGKLRRQHKLCFVGSACNMTQENGLLIVERGNMRIIVNRSQHQYKITDGKILMGNETVMPGGVSVVYNG